jgi:LPXTG-motif cell wall-anchored protein
MKTIVFLLAGATPLIVALVAFWFGPRRRKSFRGEREP